MLERDIERRVKGLVEWYGGLWLKFSSPGNAGVPDRVMVIPRQDGGADVHFVELKTAGGTLSPIQKAQIERLRKCGASVFVTYGQEEALRAVTVALGDARPGGEGERRR